MRNAIFLAISAASALLALFVDAPHCDAHSPMASRQSGRLPIIATGDLRHAIKSMPIECRPSRPLHFYGNTVRRRYYRSEGVSLRSVKQFHSTVTVPSLLQLHSSSSGYRASVSGY
ncbi:hypothetical protein [Stieleria varia]|nr:hypothetical protein [Stieleria varia]